MNSYTARYRTSELASDDASRKSLRCLAGSILASSCLVLALGPAAAYAAPPAQGDFGQAPAMEQGFAPDGGAPEQAGPSEGAPNDMGGDRASEAPGDMGDRASEAPNSGGAQEPTGPSGQMGQMGPQEGPDGHGDQRNNELDDAVRQALADDYGVETRNGFGDGQRDGAPSDSGESANGHGNQEGAFPFGSGLKPDAAPELPEGATNVQQVIDSIRDLVLKYSAATLASADYTDSQLVSGMSDYVKSSNAARAEMFANEKSPESAQEPANGEKPADEKVSGENPSANVKLSTDTIKSLLGIVMGALGMAAGSGTATSA